MTKSYDLTKYDISGYWKRINDDWWKSRLKLRLINNQMVDKTES